MIDYCQSIAQFYSRFKRKYNPLIFFFFFSLFTSTEVIAHELPRAIMAFGLSESPFDFSEEPGISKSGEKAKVNVCYVDNLFRVQDDMRRLLTFHAENNREDVLLHQKKQLNLMLQNAECRYQGQALGLKRLPAIVFDQHFVLYGERRLDTAIQTYQSYLNGHGETVE